MGASGIRSIVSAGLLAGLFAGIAAGMLGLAIGESRIDGAIEWEESQHGHGSSHEGGSLVSRPLQHVGLVVATGLYGLSVGGLLAFVFAAVRGRTEHRSDARLALALTAALFLAAVAVPFVKFPANPPGVGDPGSIGYRTELYLVMVAGCLAALLAGWRVARLVPPARRIVRPVAGAATFALLVGLLALALPVVDEVPPGFPADLLAEFRVTSWVVQLTLWCVMGGSFARLVSARPRLRRARPPVRG